MRDKTLLVSGGSRGIGLAIALRAARDGANVVLAAKTDRPHPVLPGTVHTAAEQVEAAGGRALAVVCDVRDEARVQSAVEQATESFGGIDALVLSASALALKGTLDLPAKRYDLMSEINQRGTFLMGEAVHRHSRKPEIMGEAAHWILSRNSRQCSGNFFIDETVLRENGITDFDVYANDPSASPYLDLLVDEPGGNYFPGG